MGTVPSFSKHFVGIDFSHELLVMTGDDHSFFHRGEKLSKAWECVRSALGGVLVSGVSSVSPLLP